MKGGPGERQGRMLTQPETWSPGKMPQAASGREEAWGRWAGTAVGVARGWSWRPGPKGFSFPIKQGPFMQLGDPIYRLTSAALQPPSQQRPQDES